MSSKRNCFKSCFFAFCTRRTDVGDWKYIWQRWFIKSCSSAIKKFNFFRSSLSTKNYFGFGEKQEWAVVNEDTLLLLGFNLTTFLTSLLLVCFWSLRIEIELLICFTNAPILFSVSKATVVFNQGNLIVKSHVHCFLSSRNSSNVCFLILAARICKLSFKIEFLLISTLLPSSSSTLACFILSW